jgi:hypothetical protein
MENKSETSKMYGYDEHQAMKWYGWGSPVGLGLFFVEIAVVALIVRIVILGKLG